MKLYYKDDFCTLTQGDCLEVMAKMVENGLKFDAIITDPPYGTTACKWDTIIPFDKMWEAIRKLRKENTPVVLFGSEPFSSLLRCSNLKEFKYDWIWKKDKGANFASCKKVPMKIHEIISVFGGKTYFPIMKERPLKNIRNNKPRTNTSSQTGTEWFCENSKGSLPIKYPESVLEYNSCREYLHPTQKSLELMEYLIETYTKENDTILDFTCGSGTTLLAAKRLKRRCYGIELEEKYCEITKNRLINQ